MLLRQVLKCQSLLGRISMKKFLLPLLIKAFLFRQKSHTNWPPSEARRTTRICKFLSGGEGGSFSPYPVGDCGQSQEQYPDWLAKTLGSIGFRIPHKKRPTLFSSPQLNEVKMRRGRDSPATKLLPSQKFVWAPPRCFASAKQRSGVRISPASKAVCLLASRKIKTPCGVNFAEAVRFELTIPFGMPPFQGGALDRYATPPASGLCREPNAQ